MEQAVIHKWEYLVDDIELHDDVADALNRHGGDGWELVSVVREGEAVATSPAKTMRSRRDRAVHLFFKRPKGF